MDSISTVRAGYDRWASIYDLDGNPMQALEGPIVRAAIGDAHGLHVLDLGCGTGRHALWLAENGATVTAVDFSDGMIAQARRKPHADSLGESKHGEQTMVGIKVTREGKRDVSMFFDKKTGLLTKVTSRVIDEFSKKEVTQDVVMTGYRDKDGVKVFDKMSILLDGKELLVEEMSDQKMLEKVDEKMFAKPEGKK